MNIQDYIVAHFGQTWATLLRPYLLSEAFSDILQFLHRERQLYTITPLEKDIFRIYREIEPAQVKVVWIIQDPYPNAIGGQRVANGIALDTDIPNLVPASLRNVYSEIGEGHKTPKEWVKQGVMMLNTALTTRIDEPGAHGEYKHENNGRLISWLGLIKETIKVIQKDHSHVVYILSGVNARELKPYINLVDNYVLETPHPVARGSIRFKGCRCFEYANEYLDNYTTPVQW